MANDTTDTMNQDAIADDWAQALEEQANASTADSAPAFDADTVPTPTPQGATASSGAAAGSGNLSDIQMVLDIPVTLSVELGRVKVPIKYILQLGQGSIVELDALAGEPMDEYEYIARHARTHPAFRACLEICFGS